MIGWAVLAKTRLNERERREVKRIVRAQRERERVHYVRGGGGGGHISVIIHN